MENFTLLLKKYADFIVRVGVNPQPGQTLVINCCLEAAPLARLCVRSAYEAGARDVLVNWSDNDVSRSRMELGSEEALTDFKSYQLRRYLDYAESEGGVCVLHILADDPETVVPVDVTDGSAGNGWKTASVDLSQYAGKKIATLGLIVKAGAD